MIGNFVLLFCIYHQQTSLILNVYLQESVTKSTYLHTILQKVLSALWSADFHYHPWNKFLAECQLCQHKTCNSSNIKLISLNWPGKKAKKGLIETKQEPQRLSFLWGSDRYNPTVKYSRKHKGNKRSSCECKTIRRVQTNCQADGNIGR